MGENVLVEKCLSLTLFRPLQSRDHLLGRGSKYRDFLFNSFYSLAKIECEVRKLVSVAFHCDVSFILPAV